MAEKGEGSGLVDELSADIPADPVVETAKGDAAEPVKVEPVKAEPEAKAESATPAETKEKPTEEPWHVKAVMAEREKRQKAEAEVQELRKKLEPTQPEKRTSVFEDEGKFVAELGRTVEDTVLNQTLNLSQFMAEREFGKGKVAESVAKFKELAAGRPEIVAQFRGATSPFHELMDIVSKHAELEQMKDLPTYKAKLEAEIRAKIEAENKAKEDGETSQLAAITPSLASKRAVGGVKGSASLLSLGDVFKT